MKLPRKQGTTMYQTATICQEYDFIITRYTIRSVSVHLFTNNKKKKTKVYRSEVTYPRSYSQDWSLKSFPIDSQLTLDEYTYPETQYLGCFSAIPPVAPTIHW